MLNNICDMIYHGQMHKLASGGKGGQGNVRFKSLTKIKQCIENSYFTL
ncbi:GTPase Obg domain-containing protein [Candidatus Gromoviella agglomerans]|nr:GTPase Obg domain-containing protein [Candidatus Gromoviella agglomerans]